MRPVNLQLLAVTIALGLNFGVLIADTHLWTSLHWTQSATAICPDLPLSTQSFDTCAMLRSSPSSILGRGLWLTQGALRWNDSTAWWQVGTTCRATAGWTDAAAHAVRGWQVSETATLAISSTVQGAGAAGFPWTVQAWTSVALMWQGWQHTWLGCTVRNALALSTSPVDMTLEMRLGVRHQVDDLVLTADVIQQARHGLSLVSAASTSLTDRVAAGLVVRTMPQAARMWCSVALDGLQDITFGIDVSALGWSPALSYSHAL
jgi:hypothetical protein